MGKKRKSSGRILSQRGALQIKERYERSVSKKKEGRLGTLENLFKDLEKYQTKSGNVDRRKLRSDKAKEDYNRLVREIQSLGTVKKRKAQKVTETKDVIQNNFRITGSQAGVAAQIFVENILPEIPGFATSEAVMSLSESGFDVDTIYKILNYMADDINLRTPDEMKKFRKEDDLDMFITHCCNLHELAPDIPSGDIILLAQHMTDLGFNNYEATIEEYNKEQENDEEDEED